MTTLWMIAALVMLAGVVVVKIVTLEMLAAHHRRYARLQEALDAARSTLRAEATRHARLEREWRAAEHKRHRLNVRIARVREEIGLLEYDDWSRAAHFDLLSLHKVER